MIEKLIEIYVFVFGRKRFIKLNKFLFRLSLGGLGVLNYKNSRVSGEKYFLKNYLSGKSGVVIDVGANEGNYTSEAIEINRNLKVFSFEPHPLTFAKLERNLEKFKNAITINKGMSSIAGRLNLYDYPNEDGSSHASLFEGVIKDIHRSPKAVSHEVDLITLDQFLIANKIEEVLLLKIDTEGNELEVLKGALTAIKNKKIKAIHFEFNEMNVISRSFFKDFWPLLKDYDVYRLLPNEMLELKNYNPLMCEIFAYQNIVAIMKC
jgi:FkbM family methyltransferase